MICLSVKSIASADKENVFATVKSVELKKSNSVSTFEVVKSAEVLLCFVLVERRH